MKNIHIVGIGMTPFGKFPERTVKDLTSQAVSAALSDARAAKNRIGAVFFANAGQGALEGQFMVPGEIALRAMGFEGIPVVNVENACASGGTALHQACAHVAAGLSDVALAVGAEKMCIDDRDRMFAVFDGAWDVQSGKQTLEKLQSLGSGISAPGNADPGRSSLPRSVFMDIYSALARYHMKRFGSTQKQLAAVASKNHRHSTMNPLSQYRNEMTVEEILKARVVSWPLTLPMCAPISDGSAAAVVCSRDALRRFDMKRSVRVHACVLATGIDRRPEELDKHICRRAALRAYDISGVGPGDMSLAEVHDATAFAEVQQTENLGFCEFGQGGWLAERGLTGFGGKIPVNTSGGLESKGHPIGATGLGQIHEIVTQLRGEAGMRQVPNARFGVAENGGGFLGIEEAVACVTILGRHDMR